MTNYYILKHFYYVFITILLNFHHFFLHIIVCIIELFNTTRMFLEFNYTWFTRLCLEQKCFNLSKASSITSPGGHVTSLIYPPIRKHKPGNTLKFSSISNFRANSASSEMSNSNSKFIFNIMYIAPFGMFILSSGIFFIAFIQIWVLFRSVCI